MKGKDGLYNRYIKRGLDILCSSAALIVLGIPMGIIALVIKKDMGSPVLFKQERIGKDERPFNMLKFRSMRTAFDEYGVPLPDSMRMTKLGRFIRSTSIDELPSLINILKGDMSIVGPRPLPSNYLPWYYPEERKRHLIRGGLTGLAQTNGRNDTTWEKRFAFDIEYVENVSFILDVRIIINTIMQVVKRENIGERGNGSPEDFHVLRSGKSERELVAMEKNK